MGFLQILPGCLNLLSIDFTDRDNGSYLEV